MMKDIYYNPEYCKLYEKIEDGTVETFTCESEAGKIEHLFIKRKIHSDTVDGYFDIITPYGYGGPLIIDCRNKESLLAEFGKSFSAYCEQNRIVSEFIRFHPISQNALDFTGIYDVEYSRHTVGTNIRSIRMLWILPVFMTSNIHATP